MKLTTLDPRKDKKRPGAAYSFQVARTREEVSALRGAWQQMQPHPNADIDFYLMILETRKEILRPHVIVLCRDGCPEAMLVGRLEERSVEYQIGYHTVFQARARVLNMIYGGRLGNPLGDHDKRFVEELLGSLKRGEADMAVLSYVAVDSPLYQFATTAPGFLWRDHFLAPNPHWKMSVPDLPEEIYEGHTRKLRWGMRKLIKHTNGKLRIEHFCGAGDLERLIQTAERVAVKGYQRELEVGFLDDEEMRRRIDFASKRGWLSSYILYVGDEPWAYWIGTLHGTTLHSNFIGFDPKHRKYSPGTFLFMKVLEDLCGRGVKEIDFGLGDAPYKQRFGNQEWQEASVHIFAPTWKGAQLNLLRTSTVTMSHAAKKVLGRTRLLERVKRVWRDRLIAR